MKAPVFTGAFSLPTTVFVNFFDGLEANRMKRRAEANTMKTKNNKGQAMRDARRRLGWTQLDLARRAGCTESLITKIETGRATPERWLKESIARELNIATWEVEASVSPASNRNQIHESNARSI